MFRKWRHTGAETVTVVFEGKEIEVPAGVSVAAAVLLVGVPYTRKSPVSGSRRTPYCQMGICFECLMEIDGVPNRQACMTTVQHGMTIRRQKNLRGLGS